MGESSAKAAINARSAQFIRGRGGAAVQYSELVAQYEDLGVLGTHMGYARELADERDALTAHARNIIEAWDATRPSNRPVGLIDAISPLRNFLAS